jgi:hypothetical protein
MRGRLAWVVLIAILLALLGLYSFSSGYRVGSDMAERDNSNLRDAQ